MRVRVLSRYTQVVKQSNSVSLETPTTSSEVACKKKLAREFGLPHFLLLNQTHEVWFSVYAIPSLFFWVPLRIYPPKFGRRLCEKILRICSQIPPKFDLLTFAHTSLRLPILANEPKGSIL